MPLDWRFFLPPTPPSFAAKAAVACLAQDRKRVSSGVVDLVIEKIRPKKKRSVRESGCYGRRSVLADSWSQDGLVQTVQYLRDKVRCLRCPRNHKTPRKLPLPCPRRRGTFLQILGEGVERPRGKRF